MNCSECKEDKPLEDFGKEKNGLYGRRGVCKKCRAAYQKKQYQKTKEKRLSSKKVWYDANKEKILQKDKDRYWSDPEKARTRVKEWQENNPGNLRATEAKKRAAKLKRTPSWADWNGIRKVYEECSLRRSSGEDVSVDHIIPLQGKKVSGLHVHNNLRIISFSENSSKCNKFIEELCYD